MENLMKSSTVQQDQMGVSPQRVFPTFEVRYPDPFILMDHFAMKKPNGFPDHPHRGFEIISYVLQGEMAHEDNQGHASVISTLGVQAVTAGRGLVHSEMPATDGTDSGLQLWINLPRKDKSIDPYYENFAPTDIPETTFDGVKIRTIVGEGSPVQIQRPIIYYDVTLEANREYQTSIPENYQGFIYVLSGSGTCSNANAKTNAASGDLVLVAPPAGDTVYQIATDEGIRFVIAAGLPIGEVPRYNGPFVD